MVRTVKHIAVQRRMTADGELRATECCITTPKTDHCCLVDTPTATCPDACSSPPKGAAPAGWGATMQGTSASRTQPASRWDWAVGMSVTKQEDADAKLNGTPNAFAVSVAFARAGACYERASLFSYAKAKLEASGAVQRMRTSVLPYPVFTIFSGGRHGGNLSPLRGVGVCPVGAATFADAARMACETYQTARRLAIEEHGADAGDTGYDGGIVSPTTSLEWPVRTTHAALAALGYDKRAELWIDVGAEDLYVGSGLYELSGKSLVSTKVPSATLLQLYRGWSERYPVCGFQDPFYAEGDAPQDDREAWDAACLLSRHTATSRFKKVPNCTCPIISPLDHHTVTSFVAYRQEFKSSSEAEAGCCVALQGDATEDAKDAAIGVVAGVDLIRLGAPVRAENTAKVNELIRIEEALSILGRSAYGKRSANPYE